MLERALPFDQLTPVANIHDSQLALVVDRLRSGIAATCIRGSCRERSVATCEPVSRRVKPVSAPRIEVHPEIPNSAAETLPRNRAKQRLNASSARAGTLPKKLACVAG